MKKILLLLSMLPWLPLYSQEDTTAKKILINEGTIITVRLMHDVSSEKAYVGELVELETTSPIMQGDQVIIASNSRVFGKVTEASKRKGLGKAGRVAFSIDYLTTPSGKNIQLASEIKAQGKGTGGAAAAQAVLLTPLFLLKKGKSVTFERGREFKVFVKEDTEL